jgi:polar amino acid transport system substrate-binding protein
MKKILAFVLLCVILLTVAGCASTTGKLDKIQKNGEIVVYTDPNFSPFEFLGADGITGVDIEIAKAIAAELNVKVTFQEANFDSILMAIKGGKGDIAISGFTITDERKKSVDFSDPYIESVQYLILIEGSDIAILEDLAGKKVGVAKGYTGQFLMEDETADGGALAGSGTELKEYNSAMEATLDLKAGRIDAVVMDEYVAKNIVANNSGVETKALAYKNGELAAEEYGVALPKGNEDLLAKINAVIKRLIEEDKIREWVIQFSE